ncbi:hypothetical protein KPL74_20785 [Bacillus sp. NP157]|nr:hypothetical protein KPL74_20785 [Bacillus sp. NP157]
MSAVTRVESSIDTALEDDGSDPVTPLTFAELNRWIVAIPDYDHGRPAQPRAKIGAIVGFSAFVLTLVVQHLPLQPMPRVWIIGALLVIELAGVGTQAWYSRGEVTSIRRTVSEFMSQLDFEFPHHFKIREWLVSQPMELLERHAVMAKFRAARMAQKYPMVAGNIPSLGLIPVVAAVYYQGREIMSGRNISLIDGIFIFAIGLAYYLMWTATSMKLRLDGVNMYLQDALKEAKRRQKAPRKPANQTMRQPTEDPP